VQKIYFNFYTSVQNPPLPHLYYITNKLFVNMLLFLLCWFIAVV